MNSTDRAIATVDWPVKIYDRLKAAGVRQVSYVPDAGHSQLIALATADREIDTIVLTTEEEGIAVSAGAWLGGEKSVVLMQSSGVGNCINMLSLAANCRFPLLMIITMRGEWAEFNPWQVPMGRVTCEALALMGVQTVRVDDVSDIEDALDSAITMAFDSDLAVAIILSQRLLGRKQWNQ